MDKATRRKAWRIAAAGSIALVGAIGFALFAMAGPGHDGPPQKDMAIDQAMRAEVVGNVIAQLDQSYVYPEKAAALGRQLRTQLQHGDFDKVSSAATFADALTGALQRDTHDKHLVVRYFEKDQPVLPAGQAQSPDDAAAERLHAVRMNYGFAKFERLHGDIGYLDLHQFARPQGAAGRIAAAMDLLADTKALIVDLRQCGGGDPETVMLLASYFYDTKTHLNDIYWRDENRTEQRWTTDTVPGNRYGEARKVYVLTSGDTFSACEDFAYALKNNGRATLVGETTGGGAHPGNPHRVAAHFQMFVPDGRAINPVTHTDWEAVGVVPNVQVSAKKALDVAQIAILKDLIANERDAEWRQGLEHTLADLE